MRKPGVILEIKGKDAIVQMERGGAECGREACPLGESPMFPQDNRFFSVEAKNEIDASPGEKVLVEAEDGVLLQGAFFLYLFPIFFLLGLYLLLDLTFSSSFLIWLLWGGGLVFYGFFLRRLDRKWKPRYRVVGFLDAENCANCPLVADKEKV